MSTEILANFNRNLYNNLPQKDVQPKAQQFVPQPSFTGHHDEVSKKTKVGVFFTTLAGVAGALAILAKCKKMSFVKALKSMEYEGKEVMTIAAGSVLGGLAGGALLDDKKNIKAKLRESIVQIGGNISMPLICVLGGLKLIKKGVKSIPSLKKFITSNKILLGASKAAATAVCLISGVIAGNRVSNLINEKIFHKKVDRKLKVQDFSAHIDDLCMGVSLVTANSENVITKSLSRAIPAALLIAGNSVGRATENGGHHH